MEKKDGKKRDLFFSSAIGAVLGMVVTLVFLYAFAVLVAGGRLPSTLGEPLILVAALLGVIVGSLLAIRHRGRAALPSALLCGAAWFLLLVIFSAFSEGGIFDLLKLKLAICAVAGSAFASAVHLSGETRKIKRARRKLYK